MLKNNKLLVDEDCPLCVAYGAGFTRLGLIDPRTVSPYQRADEALTRQINMQRARSEIALYDETTTRTVYGMDAMIAIVTHRSPWLRRLLTWAPLYFLLQQLYSFISYNRKVIYPSASRPGLRDCTPPLHRGYRWGYILLVALLTGLVLNRYAFLISTGWGLPHDPIREYFICFGQVAWQGIAIGFLDRKKVLTYLGNMSTVSLMGAILLLPLLGLASWVPVAPWLLLGYFAVVVGIMLLEHLRRCRLLGISHTMTFSWVAYRTVVLGTVLSISFL